MYYVFLGLARAKVISDMKLRNHVIKHIFHHSTVLHAQSSLPVINSSIIACKCEHI